MTKEIIKNKIINELQNLLLVLELLPTDKIVEELDKMYSNTNINYLEKFKDNNDRMNLFFKDKIDELKSGNDESTFSVIKGLLSISRVLDGLGSGDSNVSSQVSNIGKKIYEYANEYVTK